MKNKFLAITLLSVLCVASPSHLAFAVDKQTVGWVEMVSILSRKFENQSQVGHRGKGETEQ
jgi:hypothetical protein